MPDLPAPQHSAALNRMLGLPDPEPPKDTANRLEREIARARRRRTAAERSRARKTAA